MVIVHTSSVEDRSVLCMIYPLSCHAKYFKVDICCFSARYAKSKSKDSDWLWDMIMCRCDVSSCMWTIAPVSLHYKNRSSPTCWSSITCSHPDITPIIQSKILKSYVSPSLETHGWFRYVPLSPSPVGQIACKHSYSWIIHKSSHYKLQMRFNQSNRSFHNEFG